MVLAIWLDSSHLAICISIILTVSGNLLTPYGSYDFVRQENETCLKFNMTFDGVFKGYKISCDSRFRENPISLTLPSPDVVTFSDAYCGGFLDGDEVTCVLQAADYASVYYSFLHLVIPCFYEDDTNMLKPTGGFEAPDMSEDRLANIYWSLPTNDADLVKTQVCCWEVFNDAGPGENTTDCYDQQTVDQYSGTATIDLGAISSSNMMCNIKTTHTRSGKEFSTCDTLHIYSMPNSPGLTSVAVYPANGSLCIGIHWFEEELIGLLVASEICCADSPYFIPSHTICDSKVDSGRGSKYNSLCVPYEYGDYFLFCFTKTEYNTNRTHYTAVSDSHMNPPTSLVKNVILQSYDSEVCVQVNWTIPRSFFNLTEYKLCCGSSYNCTTTSLKESFSTYKSVNLSAQVCLEDLGQTTLDCDLMNSFYPNMSVSQSLRVLDVPEQYSPPHEISFTYDGETCISFHWQNLHPADFIHQSKITCKVANISEELYETEEYTVPLRSSQTTNMSLDLCSDATTWNESLSCIVEVSYVNRYNVEVGVGKGFYCQVNDSLTVPAKPTLVVEHIGETLGKGLYNISWISAASYMSECFGLFGSYGFALNITSLGSSLIHTNQTMLEQGLEAGVEYMIMLYAYYDDQLISLTSTNGTAIPIAPQTSPRNITLHATSSNCVNITWLPPAYPNGVISHYEVICSGQEDHSNSSTLSLSACGFIAAESVICNVTAFNQVGNSEVGTSELVVMPCSKPEAILNLSASEPIKDDGDPNVISISWNLSWLPGEHYCNNISSYEVVVVEWNKTATTSKPEFTLSVSEANKKFTVMVYAVNDAQMRGEPVIRLFTFNETAPDVAPSLLLESINSSCINVVLGYPANGSSTVRFYSLQCHLPELERIVLSEMIKAEKNNSETSVVYCGIQRSTTLACRAQVTNLAGNSENVYATLNGTTIGTLSENSYTEVSTDNSTDLQNNGSLTGTSTESSAKTDGVEQNKESSPVYISGGVTLLPETTIAERHKVDDPEEKPEEIQLTSDISNAITVGKGSDESATEASDESGKLEGSASGTRISTIFLLCSVFYTSMFNLNNYVNLLN